MAMRIVAGPAVYSAFPEALRTFQCFNHERGLPEAAVFVETFSRELGERLPHAVTEKLSRGNIVQFTFIARIADRRLHMALSANGNKLTAIELVEIHWWIQWLPWMVIMLSHFYDVTTGRTMAHLAIDSGLLKFKVIGIEACSTHIPQLAGVAHGANSLITGRRIELLPGARVCSLASCTVNHTPKIDPTLVE